MILYHGSTIEVRNPRADKSRDNLDFGKGVYLTEIENQAATWAKRKAKFTHATPVVNVYELDDSAITNNYRTLKFHENDKGWLEFVCRNRCGKHAENYDLIIGGVADDKVIEAVDMYIQGLWDIDTTVEALSYYDENNQYCITNQNLIDNHLKFIKSYEVEQ